MLGVVHSRIAFPLLWTMGPKQGNSNSAERMDLLERFETLFPQVKVACLTADREFVGKEWVSFLMMSPLIPFRIRRSHSELISSGSGKTRCNGAAMFHSLPYGQTRILSCKRWVWGRKLYVVGWSLADGQLLIVATNISPKTALTDYAQRWGIETLFAALKTLSFNLESTHFQDGAKLNKLVALLAIAKRHSKFTPSPGPGWSVCGFIARSPFPSSLTDGVPRVSFASVVIFYSGPSVISPCGTLNFDTLFNFCPRTEISSIQDEYYRESLLYDVASHLPQELMERALVVTQSVSEVSQRSIFSQLAPNLPQKLVGQALEVARAIQNPIYRAICGSRSGVSPRVALNTLIPHIPDLAQEVFEIICSLDDETIRENSSGFGDVFGGLASYLSQEQIRRAWEITKSLTWEYGRVEAIVALAPYLSDNLMLEALEVNKSIQNESYRGQTFEELVPYLPSEFIPNALEIIDSMQPNYRYETSLKALAPRLSQELIAQLHRKACSLDEEDQEHQKGTLLICLAPYLSPELMTQTLEMARGMQDECWKARILIALTAHWPQVLMEAFEATCTKANANRSGLWEELIPHLPQELINRALKMILTDNIDDGMLKMQCSDLAPGFISPSIGKSWKN